jgi:ribosomal protein S18 acetylase RimI-like enzyme
VSAGPAARGPRARRTSAAPRRGPALVFDMAGPGDIPALLALMRDYYAFDGLSFSPAQARRRLRELIQSPALGMAWLLRAGGPAPVGYVVVTFAFGLEHGRRAEVDEIYLRPEARRRGFGGSVLRVLEESLRAAGFESVHADVEHDNRDSRAFWTRHGFRVLDRAVLVRMLAPKARR